MAKSLFIAPTSLDSGLTSVCLGLLRALEREGVSVGFYKPFSQSVHRGEVRHNDGKDSSVEFVRSRSHRQTPDPIPLKNAQQQLNQGKGDLLLETIVGEYQKVAKDFDVVIIEGLVPDRSEAYIARLNVEVARNLGSEVILVSTPRACTASQIDEELDFSARLFAAPSDPDVIAVILNKVGEPEKTGIALDHQSGHQSPIIDYRESCKVFRSKRFHLLGQIPWQPNLQAPRVSDVARELEMQVLHEGQMHTRRVQRVSVCARSIRNMTDTLKPGTLMVTPGDREDIVVTTAVAALNGVPLAGLMLTGGLMPDDRVIELCRRALGTGLPVLSSSKNTYETAHMLASLSATIPIDDPERIEQAMESVATRMDTDWLQEHLRVPRQSRLSPPAFRYRLSERARAANKRIVLPEGSEPRTVHAAIVCHQRNLARCVLIGNPQEIQSVAGSQGLELPDDLEILDPQSVRERYIAPMVELRKHKGLTHDMAEAMLEDNVVLGTMMVALDEADGLVSGAIHTTANTVRPALQLIKTHEGAKVVSSVFFMLLPQQVLVYGDCAINPDPGAEELADIAIQSAESAEAFGIEPVVAMISYSTGESGTGADVDKVREATRIARERRPDLLIDGPLQYDAAAIESVGRAKAPDSKVAGKATVFVFPDLNTGNTTYKAVQRSANVVSVGPMLQGLRKPVNDLSRGALVEDIVFTIALTAVQARQVEASGVA
ncbi:phosphate acetyltransferase [Marinobacter halophilus]|uniref:Phosphate acetyltransferase n=1 Tax=Marinobacter halophilus TaxID=1323740 RepID=A0A2T1KH80_9GAMM|nr:phosphate acetyltransferase [Marinobacter halophilus]PSF09410.1 phosphate acetyltransferase [Marinobacter halophilus]GGC78140.1 phosphate acetyltransferase [Marinobacter halophilus]